MSAENIRPLLLRPAALAIAAGDLAVAALLSQIMYWYLPGKNGQPKMTAEHEGVLWIAKTGEGWMSETRLTPKRYKRALSILKTKGLVEVRMLAFKGKWMGHLRLLTPPVPQTVVLPETQPVVPEQVQEVGGKHTNPMVANTPTLGYKRDQPMVVNSFISNGIEPSIIEYIIDELNINSELTFATDKALPKSMGKKMGVEEKESIEDKNKEIEKEKEIEVGDILKAKKCNSEGELLTAFWVKQCSQIFKEPQKPLTAKEMSQLTSLAQYHGEYARFVILWVMYHWEPFVQSAANQAGLKCVPAKPTVDGAIEFLLLYHSVVVNMMAEATAKLAAQKVKMAGNSPLPEYVPKDMPPDEEPASLEEVEAMVAEFQ